MVWFGGLMYRAGQPSFKMEKVDGRSSLFDISTGYRLDDNDLKKIPFKGRQTNKNKLCDMWAMPAGNAVSERFKAIIEEFEPGVHQFVPLELYAKDGTPIEGNYYSFNACQMFPSVLVKQSGLEKKWTETRYEKIPYIAAISDMVISRSKVAGRHVWKNQIVGNSQLFFSNELMARMKQEKIKYMGFRQQEESDDPWIAEENIQPFLDWVAANPEEYSKHRYLKLGE